MSPVSQMLFELKTQRPIFEIVWTPEISKYCKLANSPVFHSFKARFKSAFVISELSNLIMTAFLKILHREPKGVDDPNDIWCVKKSVLQVRHLSDIDEEALLHLNLVKNVFSVPHQIYIKEQI